MLLFYACLPCLPPDFLGGVASHSLGLYRNTVLDFYFTVGQLLLGQISFGPLLTTQRSTVESTLKEFPSMPKLNSAWQTHGGTSSVIHTILFQKMVCRQNMIWRQIHRPIHASQMPDGLVSASKLRFQYLHGSWFWVFCTLHLSAAG